MKLCLHCACRKKKSAAPVKLLAAHLNFRKHQFFTEGIFNYGKMQIFPLILTLLNCMI